MRDTPHRYLLAGCNLRRFGGGLCRAISQLEQREGLAHCYPVAIQILVIVMLRILVRIRWKHGFEFVSLDPECLPLPNTYITTTEYWEDERETVKYTVLCAGVRSSTSKIELDLRYAAAKNKKLVGRNDAWGRCALVVDLSDLRASANWTDLNNSEYNGAGRCVVLEDELLDKYSYEQISRLKRPKQTAVRLQLLQMYGRCALTGETTRAVLDAAHIIEAAKSGANTRNNCFLLRSDLHRLFDRGLLAFTPDGAAVFAASVSDRYLSEFSGRVLPADVLENVGGILTKRFGKVTG